MTAEAPIIHAHADFLEHACAAKSRWPLDTIVSAPRASGHKLTYYVVNQPYLALWRAGRAVLPNERINAG
jgi:hypothetical protein